jgi:DNA repair protein RecO (recombination protein O)
VTEQLLLIHGANLRNDDFNIYIRIWELFNLIFEYTSDMIYKTRGIVFKTIKYSETSVVSKIYTERFGLRSYIVNGVRSAKSKTKASILQSLSMVEMEIYHHEHRSLNRIREIRSAFVFARIPFDVLRGSVGLFMIEVLNKSIREEEANEPLFRYIFEKIKLLDEVQKLSPLFLIHFLLELSVHLGFHPHGHFSEISPHFDLKEGSFIPATVTNQYTLDESLSTDLSLLLEQKSPQLLPRSRKLLLEALLHYYQLHVPNFSRPKSLRVIEEVFRA